jgi:transposase
MGNPKGVKRDFDQLEQRRLEAARLFDQGLSAAEVARRLGVHRQSTSRWQRDWQGRGVAALKQAGRAGRKPRLNPQQAAELESQLKAGPQAHGFATALWTTERIAQLIRQRWKVRYHPDHVCRLLQKLGWSCQRPTPRARQRNEAAIQRWKKVTWPALKKRPANKAEPSSSSTRAG